MNTRFRHFEAFVLACVALCLAGCGAEGIDKIKGLEAKLKPGMTAAEVESALGKPTKIDGPVKGKNGESMMYTYSGFDKVWELEAHFVDAKLTWTSEHDSTSVSKANLTGGGG